MSQVQHSIFAFHALIGRVRVLCKFTPPLPWSSFSRNQWISLREEQPGLLCLSLCAACSSNSLQPEKNTCVPLKSEPDYSKLLGCHQSKQHNARPLGHPLAVCLWVPLPVIQVAAYLSTEANDGCYVSL